MNLPARVPTQFYVAQDTVTDAVVSAPREPRSGMSAAQVIAIVRAHWKTSLYIAAGVLVLVAAVTKLMPRTYVAAATLMVNNASNDPLVGAQFQTAAGLMGNYVSTQMELLESNDVLDAVVDRLGLVNDPDYAAGNRGGEAALHDWVASQLRKNIDIEQGRSGAQLIYVAASARNPVQAADIANAVVDVFTQQQDQRTNGPTSDRARRYSEELADLKHKVTQAQAAVSQFRSRTGTIDTEARVDVDVESLSNLERRLQDVRSNVRSGQAQGSGSREVSAPVMASPAVLALREEEARLRSRMAQLRTTLGPNHPQVVELQSQLDANGRSQAAALTTYSSATASGIAVSQTEEAALEKAIGSQRQKIMEARRLRDEGSKYQLELESAQAAYKRALDGYDQIMFVHSANVSVAGRARPPVKADKPNAIKNMLFGSVLALGLGLLLPFGYELSHRRVRCKDDVERDFGLPVLIEFEAIA